MRARRETTKWMTTLLFLCSKWRCVVAQWRWTCSSNLLCTVDKRKRRIVLLLRSSCWYTRKTSNIRKHILLSALCLSLSFLFYSSYIVLLHWNVDNNNDDDDDVDDGPILWSEGRKKKRSTNNAEKKRDREREKKGTAYASELNADEHEWPFTFETDMLIVSIVLMSTMWHLRICDSRNRPITIIIIILLLIRIIILTITITIIIQHHRQRQRPRHPHPRLVNHRAECATQINPTLANINSIKSLLSRWFLSSLSHRRSSSSSFSRRLAKETLLKLNSPNIFLRVVKWPLKSLTKLNWILHPCRKSVDNDDLSRVRFLIYFFASCFAKWKSWRDSIIPTSVRIWREEK